MQNCNICNFCFFLIVKTFIYVKKEEFLTRKLFNERK